MEDNFESVLIGKLIEENSHKRRSSKNKQVSFGNIKVDYIDDKQKTIYETKKSSKFLESAIWQMKYYIFTLKNNYTGVIEIPTERKKEIVILNESDMEYIESIIFEIKTLSISNCPEVLNQKKCKNCSFKEFCYS